MGKSELDSIQSDNVPVLNPYETLDVLLDEL